LVIKEVTKVYKIYQSELYPEIQTESNVYKDTIAWLDSCPIVYEIVTKTKSKAFGLGSSVYLGCIQKSNAPEAILGRLQQFRIELTKTMPSLFGWRAKFTLEHYKDKGFRGGFFQQWDTHFPRGCLVLDFTPETFENVIDKFEELYVFGSGFNTRMITLKTGKSKKTIKVVRAYDVNGAAYDENGIRISLETVSDLFCYLRKKI